MERFSGRFSRLETGIPSSTRSLHWLLLGIPALGNAHIIQFPFTFQFRFAFASSRSSTKNSLTFNFIVVSLMFSRFAVYFWMNWPAARVNVCLAHKRMSRMYFNFAFCYMLARAERILEK